MIRNAPLLLFTLALSLLPDTMQAGAGDKPGATAGTRANPGLTGEELEIIRNREILEHLDLLQNFEPVRYLHLLSHERKTGGISRPKERTRNHEPKKRTP